MRLTLAAVLLACLALPARADHLDQRTQETRTVLYYHVPDAVLARFLPQGWEPAAIAAGPAKGANLTVNLSEQLFAAAADGSVAADARGRAVTLSARVRDAASSENRAMVLFGITTGHDAPGPYGRHHAGTVALARTMNETTEAEHWAAATPEGDGLDVALHWTRSPVGAGHVDQQTRSSLHPEFYRIYKIDSFSETLRSRGAGIDHADEANVSASGYAAELLNATDGLVAIISVPVFQREIWLPDGAGLQRSTDQPVGR